MGNPTTSEQSRQAATSIDRPPKPYETFPLSAANCGSWQKKINKKIYYFGKWGRVVKGVMTRIQPDGCWSKALEEFEQQKEALYAGRRPRVRRYGTDTGDDVLTIKALGDTFLTAKSRKVASGELGTRMLEDYRQVCQLLADTFGKDRPVDDLAAADFESLRATMAENWGHVRLGNAITRIRSVFKYALENALIDKPILFGSEFKKPGKAVMRKQRANNVPKMLEAKQIRKLLKLANVPFRAMTLLGVNSGLGNHDIGSLPLSAINFKTGWLDFPRPKTGIGRRCPLWPETVKALKAVLAERPNPQDKADAEIVFLLSSGRRWVRHTEKNRTDRVSVDFTELLKRACLHRAGLGFYSLRHTFRTVADAARDHVAIDLIMGHADSSMGAHYLERVDNARLVAVASHVHKWLFG